MKLITIPTRYDLGYKELVDIMNNATAEAKREKKSPFADAIFYDALFYAISKAYKYGFTRGHNFAKNKHRKACKS